MIIFYFQKLLSRMNDPATRRCLSRLGLSNGASAVLKGHGRLCLLNANSYLSNCYFINFIHIGSAAALKALSLLRSAGGQGRKALRAGP
jgi:hypothetical protein